MGAMKSMYTRRSLGEDINYKPVPQGYTVIKVPDGVMNMAEIDKPVQKPKKKKVSKEKAKRDAKIVVKLEKAIQRKVKPKILIKTASIRDVAAALGKKYLVERDRNYKCRRWVVTKGDKEWFIRFNAPLEEAVYYIEQYGAVKFLKEFSMPSRYE